MDRSHLPGILEANGLDIDAHAPVVEGQSAYVVLANDVVVRIPKTDEASTRLRQTSATTSAIAPHLPVAISMPTPQAALDVPGGLLSIEPRLPGTPLTQSAYAALPRSERARLLAALRAFLGALHALPLSLVTDSGAPVIDIGSHWGGLFARGEPLLESRLNHADVRAVLDRFKWFLDGVSGWNRAVRHGDFGASNFMVDGGVLTGIVDFEMIAIGDAAYDYASLSTLSADVRSKVEEDLDEPTRQRIGFYRFTFALQEAVLAAESGDTDTIDEAIEAYRGFASSKV